MVNPSSTMSAFGLGGAYCSISTLLNSVLSVKFEEKTASTMHKIHTLVNIIPHSRTAIKYAIRMLF